MRHGINLKQQKTGITTKKTRMQGKMLHWHRKSLSVSWKAKKNVYRVAKQVAKGGQAVVSVNYIRDRNGKVVTVTQ